MNFVVGYPYTSVNTVILIFLGNYEGNIALYCPICGKLFSVRYYDPSNFVDDILLVQVRGLSAHLCEDV